ncbi:MAG: class I SAM-dependent methyltransferase [Acidobacteria bacterium]|nr:class I SAM-dependent methyltransferase [Acidobacteriota bacterium]
MTRTSEEYQCAACARLYPVIFGFPDFRISLPPHFDRTRDLETAQALIEAETHLDFEGLVHLYYRLNPEASDLHEKHMSHLAGEEDQARAALDLIELERPLGAGDTVLEVGCGLAQFLAVAAERVDRFAGADLSVSFLVLARKRLHGRGLLVLAEVERLPFPDASFAAVLAADVIEHVADQEQSIEEMGRVLRPGAPLFLATPNRFSLAPEPHVNLRGVGYLPRGWANRYVRLRRRLYYDDVRMLSAASLGRLLRLHFPGTARVLIPGLSPRQISRFQPVQRRLAMLYMALRRLPVVRRAFYLFGPFFHAVAVKR